MITAEELVQETEPQEAESDFKLGTVADLFENGTAKIQFDGEETPSEKQYAYLSSYTPAKDDRVLLGAMGGTYIILGKVNYDVSPDVEEEIDRYLFDLKQVIMKKGLSITGNTDVVGNLNVTGGADVSGTMSAGSVSSSGDITANGTVDSDSVVTGSATIGQTTINGDQMSTRYVEATSVSTNRFRHTGTTIGFFGGSMVQQKSVYKLNSTATLADVISKVNQLLTALGDYYLIYSR
jgi:hypothetical protein